MKRSFPSSLLAVIAALVWGTASLTPAVAQTNSTLVLTDTGAGNPPFATIDAMELRGSGLYWWKYGATGELGYTPTLGIKSSVSPYALPFDRNAPFYMLQGGSFPAGVERDGTYSYFTANRGGSQVGLFRQRLSSAANSTPELLVGLATAPLSTGPIGRLGRDLYFAPTSASGFTQIHRARFDEAGNFTGSFVDIAAGTLHAFSVRKILFFNATINGTAGTYGLCLQANASLWRFGPIPSAIPTPIVFLGGGVGDVGVRRDDGGNAFNGLTDKIYATTSPVNGGPVGKLVTIDPTNGVVTVIYTDPAGEKFNSLGFDNNFFFLGRTHAPSGEILRKFIPYLSYLPNPDPQGNTGWVTMETVSGTNLRSDGQWLYFTRGNEIRRVGTSVPPIVLDLEAFGIEAVQISQDLNNSVPLVAGKPVLVRAYARVAANSNAGNPTRQPSATLGVVRNNIGQGNFHPLEATTIDNTLASSLSTYRGTATRSFNFLIPAELVQLGTMRFTFTLNTTRSMIETGVANPYANNTATTPVMSVVSPAAPTIVCLPIRTPGPLYTLDTDPAAFWTQIARARSLLPAADIHVRTAALVVSRPVFRFDPPRTVQRSFDIPGQESDALAELLDVAESRGVLVGNAIGMVHPSISGFNGLGYRPGSALLAAMRSTSTGPNGWDTPHGGRTLAHELGHNFGQRHIDCGSPANPDPNYPWSPCQIGPASNNLTASIFGWDPLSGGIIDGTTVGDLLSYNASRWLSRYSFDLIRAGSGAQFQTSSPPQVLAGDLFLISGAVRLAEARASLDPAQRIPAGTYDPAAVAASLAKAAQPAGHDYLVRQVNAANATLVESALVLPQTGDGYPDSAGFTQFLNAEPGAAALQIVKDGAVLAQIAATSAGPAVAVDAPLHDAGAGTLRWSWTATDADGDPLFATVHFSADDGAHWQVVELSTSNSGVAIETRRLPGGAACRLRVIVSDGFNTAIVASGAFALPTRAPEITIIGAVPGQKLPFGAQAALTAFAFDAEEGSLAGSGISWTLAGPEPRSKNGDTLSLAGLPPGSYTATASATDLSGAPAAQALPFEVRPIAIPTAAVPSLDGEVDDPAWLLAALAQWASRAGERVSARLIRSGGRLYLGLSELPYRTGGGLKAIVGVRIDVNGSEDATAQSSDLGFFVDEDGRSTQLEGNGTVMVPRANPAAGFDSAIASGEGAWTTEFCLPEAVLGGGEHGLRIMFTIELPQTIGDSVFYRWPATASLNSPATWAPVQLGALPAPANVAPIAHAGGDRVVDPAEASAITLDGSGSRDPEGQPLTFRWTQIGGPIATLQGATSAQPSFTISPVATPTTWRFQLIVNDGALDSAPAEVRITALPVVLPAPPRDVPRFTRYPDGTVEGYFSASELARLGGTSLGGEGTSGGGTQGLFTLETSEDLHVWTPRFDASPDLLGRFVFEDLSAINLPQRFYRARLFGTAPVSSPGTALQFDGAARSVQVPHVAALNAYPLTVSAWIKTTNTAAQVGGIVSKYADGSFNGWSLFSYAGRVRGFYFAAPGRDVWDGGLGLEGGFIADGQWHHVAMVIEAAGGTLYVDGVARGSLGWAGAPGAPTNTQPLQIGRYFNYTNGFAGQIDEVSVWSAALSGLEVLDLRRRGPVGTEANLQASWRLDNATGTQASDSTANARHGTLNNNPSWVPSTAPIYR